MSAMTQVEVHEVAPGLWLWRVEHPAWQPDVEWEPLVASTFVVDLPLLPTGGRERAVATQSA